MLRAYRYEKVDQWAYGAGQRQLFPRSIFGSIVCILQPDRNRIKILEWDGDGFWLYFKRLERGHFHWPVKGDTATMLLDTKELSYLIEGAKLEKKLKREEVFERQIS